MTEQTESVQVHGKLWSLLDWSFWGAGMGDVFRMPLADAMLAAVPVETIAQAEAVMAEFLERRNIEKTGVTIYQEQRDELDQARTRIDDLEQLVQKMREGLNGHEPPVPDETPMDAITRFAVRLMEAERQLAEYEPMNPQQCPAGKHADWLIDSEHTHACPWCRVSELGAELAEQTRTTEYFDAQFKRRKTERDEARAELKKYVGAEPTIAEEMAHLGACLRAVGALSLPENLKVDTITADYRIGYIHALADMRTALEAPERTSFPPAFPWAALMDDEDLAEFLAELEHAIAEPGATPNEALTAVERLCGTWRLIAEAQHAHNTAPGPNAETGEGR